MRSRTHIVIFASALLGLLSAHPATSGTATAAPNSRLAVLDIEAPEALRAETGAVTLLLRSHLPTRKRSAVPYSELKTQLRSATGELDASQRQELMKTLGLSRLVTGVAKQSGTKLEVTITVYGEGGKSLGKATARAQRGNVNALTSALLRATSDSIGDNYSERPRGAVGHLRPFVTAASYLRAGDPNQAATALLAARADVIFDVPAAHEIASALIDNSELPFETRLAIALTTGDAKELRRLADRRLASLPRDTLGHAAKAASYLTRGDLAKARAELARLGKKTSPFAGLVRAQIAHKSGDTKTRDASLSALLLGPNPYPAALAWISRLPPDTLSPKLEREAIAAATRAKRAIPGLATDLGARALRAEAVNNDAIALISPIDLDERDLDAISRNVDTRANANDASALRLRAEMRVRQGASGALDDVNAALQLDPSSARMLDLRDELQNVATTTAGGAAKSSQLVEADEKRESLSLDDSDAVRDLALQLRPLIDAFPTLASGAKHRIAVAPLSGNSEPFYWPYAVVPDRLNAGLALALTAPPYGADVQPIHDRSFANPPARRALQQLASITNADAVILYSLRAKGSRAHVELIYYDVSTEQAAEFSGELDGQALGLTRWNPVFVGVSGFIIILIIGFMGLKLLRGSGTLVVKIDGDKAAEREVTCVRISRKPTAFHVDDPTAFSDRLRRAGAKRGRLFAELAPARTRFSKVPAGRWYVHVYGTYEKAGEIRVYGGTKSSTPSRPSRPSGSNQGAVPGETSKRIRVPRGKTTHVTFDLAPSGAEYKLSVFDGESPVRGDVWLDDKQREALALDKSGKVHLDIPMGPHTLNIKARGLHVRRNLHIADTKIHTLTINLERERRLADASTGLAISDLDGALPMEIEHREPTENDRARVAQAARNASLASSHDIRIAEGSEPVVTFGPGSSNATEALVSAPQNTPGGPTDQAAEIAAGTKRGSSSSAQTGGLQRYRPERELGRGAMGVVYQAFDQVLERPVALKVMSQEIRQYPSALEMFRQEAKALAALNHSNIVTVFDQGMDDGELFMVMEFVEGTTLEQILEDKQRLDSARAVDLTDQLCAGLSYAHGRRVIHRDIKPANIFITPDGTVKIGDFGLARVLNEVRIRQTQVRGTPLYMSPEQIRGTDIDFRSDLYAVGCTLFEMITGRPPFVEGEILYHHLHTEPTRPSALVPDIPQALDKAILSCIAKEADARVASADELRGLLRRIRGQLGR